MFQQELGVTVRKESDHEPCRQSLVNIEYIDALATLLASPLYSRLLAQQQRGHIGDIAGPKEGADRSVVLITFLPTNHGAVLRCDP